MSRRSNSSRPGQIPWAALLLALAMRGGARAESHPLEPVDTSSPRATLQGFVQVMDARYHSVLGPEGIVTRYLQSSRLFPGRDEFHQAVRLMIDLRERSAHYLDLSGLPKVAAEQIAWRLTIQLAEILARLDLPPIEAVPDAAAMQASRQRQWTLPHTSIRIGEVETGPNAGEYLFTRDSVRRIPEDFARVRDLPSHYTGMLNIYDFVFHTPSGVAIALSGLVPPRWFYGLPAWANHLVLDQPLWRWAGIAVVFGAGAGLFRLALGLRRRHASRTAPGATPWTLLPPMSLMLAVPVADIALGEVLRVSPTLYAGLNLALWATFFLALTWLVWGSGGVLAEWLIRLERKKANSTDSQLVRLASRLLSATLCIAILIEGSNRVGLPSYSVIAGLGIGGLAVALAGQQTLANLFGSLIIMFEKPFRIGHKIRAGAVEGYVEDVGFRSTRLRTLDNTLVTVPSSELINHLIENLSLRRYWRVSRVLYLVVDTPVERLDAFVAATRAMIRSDPGIRQDDSKVGLQGIGLHGYELRLDFSMHATDELEFVRKNSELFVRVAALAELQRIVFARDEP